MEGLKGYGKPTSITEFKPEPVASQDQQSANPAGHDDGHRGMRADVPADELGYGRADSGGSLNTLGRAVRDRLTR
jgi:hypothetical protein